MRPDLDHLLVQGGRGPEDHGAEAGQHTQRGQHGRSHQVPGAEVGAGQAAERRAHHQTGHGRDGAAVVEQQVGPQGDETSRGEGRQQSHPDEQQVGPAQRPRNGEGGQDREQDADQQTRHQGDPEPVVLGDAGPPVADPGEGAQGGAEGQHVGRRGQDGAQCAPSDGGAVGEGRHDRKRGPRPRLLPPVKRFVHELSAMAAESWPQDLGSITTIDTKQPLRRAERALCGTHEHRNRLCHIEILWCGRAMADVRTGRGNQPCEIPEQRQGCGRELPGWPPGRGRCERWRRPEG